MPLFNSQANGVICLVLTKRIDHPIYAAGVEYKVVLTKIKQNLRAKDVTVMLLLTGENIMTVGFFIYKALTQYFICKKSWDLEDTVSTFPAAAGDSLEKVSQSPVLAWWCADSFCNADWYRPMSWTLCTLLLIIALCSAYIHSSHLEL